MLVDGALALPRLADEIAGARSHVYLAGWHFEPSFALRRDGETGRPAQSPRRGRRAGRRARARLGGRPAARLPAVAPQRPSRGWRRSVADTRIRYALDARERPLHCHHEKIVVVDDRVAYVGGIDLTDESGDRFDSSRAPAAGRGRLARRRARASRGPPSPTSRRTSGCVGTR